MKTVALRAASLWEASEAAGFAKTAVFRAAARLESLSRASLRESETPRLLQNRRFRAAVRLESLSRASLRESEGHGFAHLTQNGAFGRHLVENRRF